ncbi:26S proteasome non-ATPase regulatory subunit [Gaertneriomyces sp. JEL0708]|nr:26S proteasome non-ATPase regulatory subunit [Gaertneriomyces sp. JEL0708]
MMTEKTRETTAMEVDTSVPEKTEEELKKEEEEAVFSDIKQNILLLERSVTALESRYATRALRATASIRKRLSPAILQRALVSFYPPGHANLDQLLGYVGTPTTAVTESMDVDTADKNEKQKEKEKAFLPEHDIYLSFLVLLYLHDGNQVETGLALATAIVEQIQSLNRRTLDQLGGRIYFYFSRFYELQGRLGDARPLLLAAQRTATLRHDDDTQATLLNLLLRSYLEYNLYDQADKLVSKTSFPEGASNNQTARYMYYLGRIKAIQLDYSTAHRHVLQATRKAPQSANAAGFQQSAHKLLIVIQLLMGEIPDRSLFRQPTLRKSLQPYLEITQAVRIGDLELFKKALEQYAGVFKRDRNYTMILRLRHNVIKTGIRMISLSYSRIALRDVCVKLQLDGEEDAEFVIAKAIRDGIISATLHHSEGYMSSLETTDVYTTTEPQDAFHSRIGFCLNLHNESVKALRFPKEGRQEWAAADGEEAKRLGEVLEEMEEDDEGDW